MQSTFRCDKGFMEWECHGRIWQLRMWRRQPERRKWRAECDVCGKVGLSYSQLINQKEEVNMATKEEKGASLRPHDFAEGGGLFQGEATWRNPRFEVFDYKGGSNSSPGFMVDMEPEEGDTIMQFWSAGNADDWTPSKNGKKLIATGKATKLSKSSNFYILLNSLVEAKFPENKMEDDVSIYDGMKCNMVRVPAPERKGLQQKERKYDPTILVVDSIITFPWEAEEKGKGGEKVGESNALTEKATEVVMEILGDNPKGIQKMKLAGEVFKRLKAQKVAQTEINAIVQIVGGKDESFLSSGPWTFEKGVVSL